MIREYRRIELPLADLTHALNSYRRLNPTFLPSGKIRIQKIAKEGTVTVCIRMSYGVKTLDANFELSAENIYSVIVRVCNETNIPIPAAGKKVIEAYKDGVCLHVHLGEDCEVSVTEKTQTAKPAPQQSAPVKKPNPSAIPVKPTVRKQA